MGVRLNLQSQHSFNSAEIDIKVHPHVSLKLVTQRWIPSIREECYSRRPIIKVLAIYRHTLERSVAGYLFIVLTRKVVLGGSKPQALLNIIATPLLC